MTINSLLFVILFTGQVLFGLIPIFILREVVPAYKDYKRTDMGKEARKQFLHRVGCRALKVVLITFIMIFGIAAFIEFVSTDKFDKLVDLLDKLKEILRTLIAK